MKKNQEVLTKTYIMVKIHEIYTKTYTNIMINAYEINIKHLCKSRFKPNLKLSNLIDMLAGRLKLIKNV